ncbi:MAG: cation transporter [Bacteroides sp.]|nr:cation transporter [Bacteroides sp.]
MQAKRWMLTLAVALFSATFVMAKDIRVVVFKVEQLCCEKCVAKVRKNIPFEKGVKGLETDISTKTVTITYDAEKTNIEKLQKGFAKFSYTAEFVKETKKEEKKK